MFPETKSRETLSFVMSRNEIKANFEKRSEIPATTTACSEHVQQRSTFRG